MPVVHVASAATATANPTTTWTVVLSASIATGNDIYVFVTSRDHAAGTARVTCIDNDTGGNTWTLIAESTDRKASIFWKRATSGTAGKTVTIAGAVGSSSGGYSAYTGGGGPSPHTNISVEDNIAANETHAGFVPDTANSMIVFAVFNTANDNAVTLLTCTNPGTLEPERFEKLSTGGLDSACIVGSALQSGGPTATGNFTWAQTDGTTKSIAFAIKPNTAPTISPNTADAHDFGSDTTPTVEFTGTDPDSDNISYNTQISSDSQFGLIDSYGESNQDSTGQLSSAGNIKIAQSFSPDSNITLTRATFYISKLGSPTGNVVATLYAHTGADVGSGDPTGSALATSTTSLDISTLTTSHQLINFDFSGYSLSASTVYNIALEYSGGDASNALRYGRDASSPTHEGKTSGFVSEWIGGSSDLCFYAYGTPTVLLDKVSQTDSGFLNTISGGDTDPFNSGEKVSFTVQISDALAGGTYYWRARATDPTGANTYSSWTTTRSFVVSSGGGQAVRTMVQFRNRRI